MFFFVVGFVASCSISVLRYPTLNWGFADFVARILSLDWITEKLFMCCVSEKWNSREEFFCHRAATMIERIVNSFGWNAVKLFAFSSCEIFPHHNDEIIINCDIFIGSAAAPLDGNFRLASRLGCFSRLALRQIKLSSWKKSLKDKHLHHIFVMKPRDFAVDRWWRT